MSTIVADTSKVLKRNNVQILGHGERALLFAHGFGCDQNVWRFITPAFTDKYKVVLFDNVGAGKSDYNAYNPHKYDKLEGYAADVLEIRHALEEDDIVFIGHSVSSMIGLLAAIEDPGAFSGIVMIGPSPRYINENDYTGGFDKEQLDQLMDMMDSNYLGWSGTVAPLIMGNAERPELGEELTENFCSTDPDFAKQFARVTFYSDNRGDVHKLSIPSLILQCSDDIIAPESVGEFLRNTIPGNDFVHLKATGHCPHLSHPEELTQAIQDFLDKI